MGSWAGFGDHGTAMDVQNLICNACWGEEFSFHPCDPYMVVGEWEVGDLSEVEAVLEIEERFRVNLPRDKLERIIEGGTFGDFIELVL